MKSFLAAAVLTITAIPIALGQDKSDKQGGNVDQKLMNIEQEVTDALIKGDASVWERYLSDTYIFTGSDAIVVDKARMIADIKSGDLKFQSSKLDDMKVQVYGNAAVVTYGSTDKGTYKGKDLTGKYRWTDVFVKRNGHWQLVAGQGTPVPKQ